MKIAFISFYSGSVDRGVESVVNDLAGHLSRNNEVVVFQVAKPNSSKPLKTQTIDISVDWTKTQSTSWFLRRLFVDYWSLKIGLFSLKLVRPIISGNYDLVMTFNGGWLAIVMRLITWLTGVKLVIAGHSGIGWDDRINLYCFPNAFIPITARALDWAKKVNPFVNLRYIPNGIDLVRFKNKGITYSSKLKRPIVLTVAALTKTKRVDLVIKAVSKLANVSLIISGQGPELQKLEALAQRLLPGRFEIIHFAYSKIDRLYRSADLFALLPVDSEAFGLVYLEAMASGLAVVAPSDPARREIVGPAGTLVEDASQVDDIAFAIGQALKRKWHNLPREQAEKFDWNQISQKYEKLFIELCQK